MKKQRHARVRVEKGYGPRHAANSKEGDLTAVNTDTVPAMLTPREAVLNRNAAELAGRGNIEQLNAEGNVLAKKGVDLAAKGQASVPVPKMPGSRRVASGNVLKYVEPGEIRREASAGLPKLAKGTENMKTKSKQTKGGPQPQQQVPPQRGGFYPPGMGFAEGTPEVAGIGVPNPSKAYDPREQVDFKAPDLSGFIRALHEEGKKQGLSEGQMAGIAKQISGGFGGGGGAPGGGSAPYDMLGGQYASFTGGTPGGYQGGISDIGYPPFLMPNAEYHADKGSSWVGPYDPAYLVQRYARGTRDVSDAGPGWFGRNNFQSDTWNEPRNLGFNTGQRGFGRPSTEASGGDVDRFSQMGRNYDFGSWGGFGNAPSSGFGASGNTRSPTNWINYPGVGMVPQALPVMGQDYMPSTGIAGLPAKRES